MQIVLPTSFFPSIAYMRAISEAEETIIDIHENYVKQNLRNRCQIHSTNGLLDLVVPVVKGRSPQTPTHTIEIAYQQDWPVRLWRSIEAAYRSSPYFEFYEDDIKTFFEGRHQYLFEYNRDILNTLLDLIGLPAKVSYSTQYVEGDTYTDMRYLCAKKRPSLEHPKSYFQVFQEKNGFLPNLSILDLLFCEGPNAVNYL